MAPWGAPLFGEAGIRCINVPTCIIAGTDDKNAVYERDQVFMFNNLTSPDGTLVSIKGVGHKMVYAPGIQDILNHYATAFFSDQLHQKLSADKHLVAAASFTRVTLSRKPDNRSAYGIP